MSGNAEELKWKLEEMLTSSDPDWANSVTVTLNAMYRQFDLERKCEKPTALSCPYGTPKRQIGFVYRKRSQDRLRCNVPELGFVLLIF
jgi:hypothetical protein